MRIAILAAGVAAAVAAAPTAWAGPFRADPLVTVTGRSPFGDCTADQNPRNLTGTNFASSELEPWVDVNPTDSKNLVGGYQQDRWSDGGARGLGFAASLDGGKTWTKGVIPNVSLCSNTPDWTGPTFERATDPWVTFGPDGSVFFFSLSFDNLGPENQPGAGGKNAVLVSKSTDKGLIWSDPVALILDTDTTFFNDKNAITADPELVDGQVYVYAVWDRLETPGGFLFNPDKNPGFGFRGPAYFARTTNGGETWEPARQIYDPAGNNQTIGNQIAMLADGALINVFDEILWGKQDASNGLYNCYVALIRSTDKGETWTGPHSIRVDDLLTTGCRGNGVADPEAANPFDPTRRAFVRTGDIIPEVAVDRNPGSPHYGTIYLVWQDFRFTADDASNPYATRVPGYGFRYDEVVLSKSTDGGFTWSAPQRINRPVGRSAFTPAIKVAADGTVGVLYYDFRNDRLGDAPLSTDAWLIHSHDGGEIWTETRVTARSFDMRKAPYARGWFTGDYMGLTASGSDFKPFFSVTTSSDPDDVVSTTVGP